MRMRNKSYRINHDPTGAMKAKKYKTKFYQYK